MKKVMVWLVFFLSLNFSSHGSYLDHVGGIYGDDRGVLEVIGIKKFKSRSPGKSIYKFKGRVLIGGNDCLAEGVSIKFRRTKEGGVDYFWIRKEYSGDLEDRFCTKEFKPVYKHFTQRITAEKLILFNVLNMGKVDADTLIQTLSEDLDNQVDVSL